MNWTDIKLWDLTILGFGAVFCFTWAIGLILTRHRIILSSGVALVCISGVRLGWEAFFFSGEASQAPMVYFLFLPIMYVIGPIIFLYYFDLNKALQQETLQELKPIIAKKNILLILLILCVAVLPLFWFPNNLVEQSQLVEGLLSDKPILRTTKDWYILFWILGPKFSILIFSVFVLFYQPSLFLRITSSSRSLKWFAVVLLVYIWLMILFDILGYLLGNIFLIRISTWSHSIAIIFVYLFSCFQPKALLEFEKTIGPVRYESTKLVNVEVDLIIKKIDRLMSEEHLYADEDLRLPRLADACNLSTHQLSEVLNKKIGLSFTNYINKFRVNAACVILREEPLRSILSIAMAVGFNSKSAFNRSFLQELGETPSAFRKKGKSNK